MKFFRVKYIKQTKVVTFDAGVHPHLTNLIDNPMQAWHDSTTGSSGNSNSLVLNMVTSTDASFAEANSLILDRLALAKNATMNAYLPSVALDNSEFSSPTIKMNVSAMYELFGEAMILFCKRALVKKLCDMKTTSSSLLCLSVGADLASSSNITGEAITELVDTEPAKKMKKSIAS
jgi:hypothetical protein